MKLPFALTKAEHQLNIFGALARITNRGGVQNVFEIRIPASKSRRGAASGYFDDPAKAAATLAGRWCDGSVDGIYVTLNPCNPALLARAMNRILDTVKETTSDRDIVARHWFPVDFDAKRPAGVSSSDEEHHAAIDRARACLDLLHEHGWPAPIFADSGNGAHLLYAIDLPNEPEMATLLRDALDGLSSVLSDDSIVVDTVNYNASRIWKLYGTPVCKGENTEQRPWRIAKILESPDHIEVVSRGKLEALAVLARDPFAGTGTAPTLAEEKIAEMGLWLEKLGIKVHAGPFTWKTGRKWVLDKCPFNEEHNRPMVAVIEGRPVFKCLHNSCAGNHWREFRGVIEPGYSEPKNLLTRVLEGESLLSVPILSAACELSSKEMNELLLRLQEHKVEGIKEFRKAHKAEKQKQLDRMAEDEGFLPDKRDCYLLGNALDRWVKGGHLPGYWQDAMTGLSMVGEYAAPVQIDIDTEAYNIQTKCHRQGMKWVSVSDVRHWLQHWLYTHQVNRIRETLLSYKWDGTSRLRTWLHRVTNCDDTPMHAAIGENFLIGMVHRGLNPGAFMDTMLVLEGEQGIGKSRLVAAIGGVFTGEYSGHVRTPDQHVRFVQTIAGKMVVEWSELKTLSGSSVEMVKAMISQPTDNVRGAYQRDPRPYPRTCVFIGTTNAIGDDSNYMADHTGNRRFLPVRCGNKINVELMEAEREQLLAEAVVASQNGAKYWIYPEAVREDILEAQSERREHPTTAPEFDKLFASLMDPGNYLAGYISLLPCGTPYLTHVAGAYFELWLGIETGHIPDGVLRHKTSKLIRLFNHCGFVNKKIIDEGQQMKRLVLVDATELPRHFVQTPQKEIDAAIERRNQIWKVAKGAQEQLRKIPNFKPNTERGI